MLKLRQILIVSSISFFLSFLLAACSFSNKFADAKLDKPISNCEHVYLEHHLWTT